MENNNDKLSHFIRNRLQSVEDANEDWDVPDGAVWKNAKSQLLPPKKEKKKVPFYWFVGIGLAILLLLSLFYNWHLMQLKDRGEEQLKEQAAVVAQLKEQLLQEKQLFQSQNEENQIVINELQVENIRLVEANEQLKIEKQQFEEQYEESLLIQDNLENSITSLVENIENEQNTTNTSTFKPLEKELLPLLSPSINTIQSGTNSKLLPAIANNTKVLKPDKSINEKKHELGFNSGFSSLRVPTSFSFGKEEKKLEQITENFTPSYQFHYGYSFKKDWWLKTGIRHYGYSYTNQFQFKTAYDKSKEFEKPDGSVANELQVQTANAGFQTTQNVVIDIPNDTNLETGDFLFGEFEEQQRINVWQVPIGVEFRQQTKKLGWQLETGLLFNIFTALETELSGNIQSTQSELPLKILDKADDSASSKFVLGVQGGIGLNYQIQKQWLLRADLLFQYQPNFSNQIFQMGVGYQFR
ncbi:MAG: hypothetical protein AAF806_03515 [Bacteroidota bacterium]